MHDGERRRVGSRSAAVCFDEIAHVRLVKLRHQRSEVVQVEVLGGVAPAVVGVILGGLRPPGPEVEQRSKVLTPDGPVQAKPVTTATPPPAGRLVGVEVVVHRPPTRARSLAVLGQPGVVGEQPADPVARCLERLYTHHDDHDPHRGRAGGPATGRV